MLLKKLQKLFPASQSVEIVRPGRPTLYTLEIFPPRTDRQYIDEILAEAEVTPVEGNEGKHRFHLLVGGEPVEVLCCPSEDFEYRTLYNTDNAGNRFAPAFRELGLCLSENGLHLYVEQPRKRRVLVTKSWHEAMSFLAGKFAPEDRVFSESVAMEHAVAIQSILSESELLLTDLLLANFALFEERYQRVVRDTEIDRQWKELRFGMVVQNLTGLSGSELSTHIRSLQKPFGGTWEFREFVVSLSSEQLPEWVTTGSLSE